MANNIELLSPAGNAEALYAAVQSGADAVYIGGPTFNARRSAKNFSLEEIKMYADYCHTYGVDLHVAVNTLMKEKELDELKKYAVDLNNAGVDALIVQDLGAAKIIRELCPQLPLHASTQMTVTSIEGVKYLENMGFSRVVLARELSVKEIENIIKNTKAEIEVFVHGALCMSYSGQCLMSSIIGGRSANRGRCAQPCRLPYCLSGNNKDINAYALSPKDLALIEELEALKKIGVKSLKIEGRLKRAEYVSAITGVYRKYLDYPQKVSKADMDELKNAFYRSGFTKGYFKNELGREMMSHKNPSNVSENVFTEEAKQRARVDASVRKIKVFITASLKKDDYLSVCIYDDENHYAYAVSDMKAQEAINTPMDEERLKAQLLKLGQTPFCAESIEVNIDEGITIPVKEVNAVRRRACEELISQRILREERQTGVLKESVIYKNKPEKVLLTCECETYEQLLECVDSGADIVYASEEILNKCSDFKNTIPVVRMSDIFDGTITSYNAVTASSAAAVDFYKDKDIYVSSRMNVYNSHTAQMFDYAKLVTVSPELNLYEIADMAKNTSALLEVIAYGRITLMLMKNCPIKALGQCQQNKNIYSLKDRKNEEFPLLCSKNCIARLINSKPIFMADKLDEILSKGVNAIRLVFTTEQKVQTKKILNLYKDAINGKKTENIFAGNEFTRGHYYRGAE